MLYKEGVAHLYQSILTTYSKPLQDVTLFRHVLYICVSVYVYARPIKTVIVGGDFKVHNSLTLDSLSERKIKRKHHIITAGSMWQKHTSTHTLQR